MFSCSADKPSRPLQAKGSLTRSQRYLAWHCRLLSREEARPCWATRGWLRLSSSGPTLYIHLKLCLTAGPSWPAHCCCRLLYPKWLACFLLLPDGPQKWVPAVWRWVVEPLSRASLKCSPAPKCQKWRGPKPDCSYRCHIKLGYLASERFFFADGPRSRSTWMFRNYVLVHQTSLLNIA